MQDDHDHLPDIIDSLQAYLQEVEDTRNDMRYRSEEYGDASDELAKLFLELEQIGEPKGPLDNIFEKLMMIEVKIHLFLTLASATGIDGDNNILARASGT